MGAAVGARGTGGGAGGGRGGRGAAVGVGVHQGAVLLRPLGDFGVAATAGPAADAAAPSGTSAVGPPPVPRLTVLCLIVLRLTAGRHRAAGESAARHPARTPA